MFSVPSILDWGPVHYTMAVYVLQGIVITLLNIPLIVILLFRKKNRDRKEFVLIACVSLIDIFYVVVNAWNSFVRLTTPAQNVTRYECIIQPSYFVSLIVSQLVANMPLMVAFDRLIAAMYGVWYYKQRHFYTLMLCAIPVVFSCFITLINLAIILTTSAGEDEVSSFCFTSTPVYKMTFHSLKWFCIVLAALVYCVVAVVLKTKTQKFATTSAYAKRISTANLVMGLSTVNSILFHLIPDFLLVVPIAYLPNNIFVQCILYSAILEKIMFNFVLFLVFHTELRSIYCGIFFRAQQKSRGSNSSGAVQSGATRMFPQGSSTLLSKIAHKICPRCTE